MNCNVSMPTWICGESEMDITSSGSSAIVSISLTALFDGDI
jgi:hypothetical protein